MNRKILNGFKLLKINKENYPDYKDPYKFTSQIKICSILDEKEKFYYSEAEIHDKDNK